MNEDVNKKSDVSSHTTKENDTVANLFSSGVCIYNYYYSIKNNNYNNPEWCNSIHYPVFKENLSKWIEFLFKPDYLAIIYYLVKNKFCHAKGLVKTLHEDVGNVTKKLQTLTKYSIIQVADKEKYKSILYKHRHAFRIDDWHFERADWYKLSDLGLKFYGGLDFSISLDSTIVDRVKNWHKYMSKKTREVDFEKEISLSRTKSILQEIKNSFRNDDRGEYGNISNSNWLIERFKGPLDVLGWTPEKTLVEIGKWRKV